jgi:hypothetical protein
MSMPAGRFEGSHELVVHATIEDAVAIAVGEDDPAVVSSPRYSSSRCCCRRSRWLLAGPILLVIASLRAICIAVTSSLTAATWRLLRITSRRPGTPIVASKARIATTTISSSRVNPRCAPMSLPRFGFFMAWSIGAPPVCNL